MEINGQVLADVSGEEVETWMIANKIVMPNDRVPEAPINQSCEPHRAMFETAPD